MSPPNESAPTAVAVVPMRKARTIAAKMIAFRRAELERMLAHTEESESTRQFAVRAHAGLAPAQAEQALLIASGKWSDALLLASSDYRLAWLRLVWPHVKPEERAPLFADTYPGSDHPRHERNFVLRAIRWFANRDIVLFDSDRARKVFDAMPHHVTIFRGAVAAEVASKRIGASWTLDRAKAVWFAARHGRFRETRSPAVVLVSIVPRDRIRALLLGRREREVLIDPATVSFEVTEP